MHLFKNRTGEWLLLAVLCALCNGAIVSLHAAEATPVTAPAPEPTATDTSSVTTAQETTSHDVFDTPMMKEVRTLHDGCIDGSMSQTVAAEKRFNELLLTQPDNQLLRVYMGSLLTLKASKALPGPNKYSYLVDGLRMMDDAVNKGPTDAAVRFVRAINNYMLPAFINRRDNARSDFIMLVKQIEDPGIASSFSPTTRQAIYYYAGLSFLKTKKETDAIQAWRRGLELNSDNDLGQKISKELKKVKAS